MFQRDDGLFLYLTFDQAIAVATFVPGAIVVIDPVSGGSYGPTGSPTISGAMITMGMTPIGPDSGTQTVLNASAGSGIVSAAGALPWAGVSGFVLETE